MKVHDIGFFVMKRNAAGEAVFEVFLWRRARPHALCRPDGQRLGEQAGSC